MIKLHDHQQEQLKFFRSRARAMSLLPFGAGKTLPTILRLRDLLPPRCVLVLTTTSMMHKWASQLRRFGGPGWEIALLDGSKRKRAAAFLKPHHVAVLNYEGVLVFGRNLFGHYKILVLDEVHRLKNPASAISRACACLTWEVDYVYALTGTPLLESPLDLFGVVRAVNPQVFGESYLAWRRRYFVPVEGRRSTDVASSAWRPRAGALVELAGAMHAMSFHRPREDLQSAYPRQTQTPPLLVELSPAVRRIYNRAEKGARSALKLAGVSRHHAATHLEKLAQLARGWIYDEAKRVRVVGRNSAANALEEYLESIRGSGSVVVWAVRKPDTDVACAALGRLGYRCEVIQGSTPVRRRDLTVRALNEGNLDAAVVHPRCAGEGIDLHAAHSLRYSYRWSAQEYIQSRGRLDRMTNAYPTVCHTDVVALRTIDEGMGLALRRKESLLELVLAARDTPWVQKTDREKSCDRHHI